MVNNSKVVQCFGANTLLAAQTMAGLVGHPDPVGVLALPPDEMLLQVAGDIAVVAKLPNYRLDPAFAGLDRKSGVRERGCQYVEISVVAGSLKKKKKKKRN